MLGKQHKEIARELGISTRTVDHHHANIGAKLYTNSLADLMHMDNLVGLRCDVSLEAHPLLRMVR